MALLESSSFNAHLNTETNPEASHKMGWVPYIFPKVLLYIEIIKICVWIKQQIITNKWSNNFHKDNIFVCFMQAKLKKGGSF